MNTETHIYTHMHYVESAPVARTPLHLHMLDRPYASLIVQRDPIYCDDYIALASKN